MNFLFAVRTKFLARKMLRKNVLSTFVGQILAVLLFISCYSVSTQANNTKWPMIDDSTMSGSHQTLVNYIVDLFCVNGTYRFFHIYVEQSLLTSTADKIISRLNNCMVAGIMTSRYIIERYYAYFMSIEI